VDVIGSGKHSSLLQYGNNYCRKKFYSTGPWWQKLKAELSKLDCFRRKCQRSLKKLAEKAKQEVLNLSSVF
jgi:hypothetical protein